MRRRAADEGFTLIELLVCVTILAVIVPAMAMAIITGLKGSTRNVTRLSVSHAAQQATALFDSDVMNATSFQSTSCGPSALISMSWNDPTLTAGSLDPTAGNKRVTYALLTVSGEQRLLRYSCQSSGESSTVIARNLLSATVTCDVTPCSSSTLAASVTLAVVVSGRADDTRSDSVADYAFTLSAKRRSLQ